MPYNEPGKATMFFLENKVYIIGLQCYVWY